MTGFEGISAAELSDLIGAIYDCSLDPQRWVATSRRIAECCDSGAGGICVHDLRHRQNDQLFVFGYAPEFLRTLAARYADSPMAVADIVANVGDVSALSMERFQPHDSRFHGEVLQPYGIRDLMWFPALRTGGRAASLHVSRGDAAAHYQPRDLGLFGLLAPHVCRALAISDALDIRVLKSELLERTLDGLAAGVFLAARDRRIVYMNTSAERQVRAGRSIRLVNDRLAAIDPAAHHALDLAIEACGHAGAVIDAQNPSIGLPDGRGGGTVATLLPVADGQRSGVLAPFAASVAIFIQYPAHVPLMPGEAFARLHGLTGSELRVLMALSQGLGGVQTADMLGVVEPTVRTHLQRIYAKTGTSKQGDLLRLLHCSTPPTRLPLRLAD